LNLVLDVPIQSQLAGVEDITIAHLDAREEVIFGSSSLGGITLSRVVCNVRWLVLLSLFQNFFEIDRPSG
jgi:hypothetical protein